MLLFFLLSAALLPINALISATSGRCSMATNFCKCGAIVTVRWS